MSSNVWAIIASILIVLSFPATSLKIVSELNLPFILIYIISFAFLIAGIIFTLKRKRDTLRSVFLVLFSCVGLYYVITVVFTLSVLDGGFTGF
ncbi:hypothetical protein [Aureibacillus halotolerans]|uniref:Uncharacterized protein n=1 Tax=Aureibacillus halotolerans TaxID=1508390 RepID=A0A4V3D4T2_9BACI|nr:hypothetical protein [Aureibacillus halotolerans]TDQ37207.1 hypothetical protein EV213_11488 [Aureibacillus halotolerans]